MLRAAVGALIGSIILAPWMLFWAIFWGFYDYGLNWSNLVIGLLITLSFLSIFVVMGYISLYLYRSVAAGSLATARCLIAVACLLLMVQVLSLVSHVFDLIDLADAVRFAFSYLGLVILCDLASIIALYLLLIGFVRFIRSRHQPFRLLLHGQKFDRKFWVGWAAFVRSLWLIMGVPVPPRPTKMAKRVTLAAVFAFFLEGWVLSSYISLPDRIGHNYEKQLESLKKFNQATYGDRVLLSLLLPITIMITVILVGPIQWWGMFALSRGLRRYARRRALPSAEAAMLADPRNPVLFLRSFSDDQISLLEAKVPWLLRFFDPGVVAGTLDELLVTEYAEVGPVIAVGRPSDRLPPLGAARRYCQGTEWQEIVRELMQASALIVVGMGRSPGLAWEIATIRTMDVLTKTIFVFPPNLAYQRSFLHDLFTELGLSGTLPQFRSDQAVLFVSVLATEGPLLFLSSRITELHYQLGLRATKPDMRRWLAERLNPGRETR